MACIVFFLKKSDLLENNVDIEFLTATGIFITLILVSIEK
jgi:hypothetical protein